MAFRPPARSLGRAAKRRRGLVAASVLAVGAFPLACIIADPPADVPAAPVLRPTIVHGSVSPSPTRILARIPQEFDVPVEITDPSVTFQWRVFVDYDALSATEARLSGESSPSQGDPNVHMRVIPFGTPLKTADPSFDTCHVIEFVVAYSFEGTSSHTPDARGGDGVIWIYDPSGGVGGCPIYDAGAFADAALPDNDASDGGSE